jgi:hypothetical protein
VGLDTLTAVLTFTVAADFIRSQANMDQSVLQADADELERLPAAAIEVLRSSVWDEDKEDLLLHAALWLKLRAITWALEEAIA